MHLKANAQRISHKDILAFSETAAESVDPYIEVSDTTSQIVVGGVDDGESIYLVVAYKGEIVYRRLKYHLTSLETRLEYQQGEVKPEVVEVTGLKILPLICYEICYPEDWPEPQKLDYVVHMVGFPMYNESQMEHWTGLEKEAASLYECPVICVSVRIFINLDT